MFRFNSHRWRGIHFTSTLGKGTTFYIYLPASERPAENDTALEKNVRTGHETILVVDDEDYVLDACKAMLTKLGYRTILAHSGEEALDIFVSIFGAVAGNLVLTGMTTGGVYLGGGISPKILPKLKEGTFMEAFTRKGRFKALLEKIPVRVILNDKAALLGAAYGAFEMLWAK